MNDNTSNTSPKNENENQEIKQKDKINAQKDNILRYLHERKGESYPSYLGRNVKDFVKINDDMIFQLEALYQQKQYKKQYDIGKSLFPNRGTQSRYLTAYEDIRSTGVYNHLLLDFNVTLSPQQLQSTIDDLENEIEKLKAEINEKDIQIKEKDNQIEENIIEARKLCVWYDYYARFLEEKYHVIDSISERKTKIYHSKEFKEYWDNLSIDCPFPERLS